MLSRIVKEILMNKEDHLVKSVYAWHQGRTGQSGYWAGARRAPSARVPMGPFCACWGDEPRPALFKTIRNRVSPGQ